MENTEFIKVMTEDETPGHYDQIEMFYENAEAVLTTLPKILKSSEEVVSYGSEKSEEAPAISPDEPLGYLACHPSQNSGLEMVIYSNPKTMKNSVKDVFPFVDEGAKYNCSIQNIHLFDNRMEAQIEAFIDDENNMLLNFFDTHYLNNRAFYNNEDNFQFIIRGFAYGLEKNEPDDTIISVSQREDMGLDHYEIQSPVKDIDELPEKINGQKVWRLGLVLGFNPDGSEIPLDVYITERSLADSQLPKEGDNISAVVWLQGHLWGIGEDED